MRVRMSHVFEGVTPDEFVSIFFSDAFNEELLHHLEVEQREQVEREEDARLLYRKLRTVVRPGVVPDSALAVLGVRRLIFHEEHEYEKGTGLIRFRITPNVFPGRAQVNGSIRLEPLEGGRLERRIEGTVSVRVLGLGRLIERVLAENVDRANETIASTMEQWLKNHKPRTEVG